MIFVSSMFFRIPDKPRKMPWSNESNGSKCGPWSSHHDGICGHRSLLVVVWKPQSMCEYNPTFEYSWLNIPQRIPINVSFNPDVQWLQLTWLWHLWHIALMLANPHLPIYIYIYTHIQYVTNLNDTYWGWYPCNSPSFQWRKASDHSICLVVKQPLWLCHGR